MNSSKVHDPRQWRKWSNSGALSTICPKSALVLYDFLIRTDGAIVPLEQTSSTSARHSLAPIGSEHIYTLSLIPDHLLSA